MLTGHIIRLIKDMIHEDGSHDTADADTTSMSAACH